MIFPGWIVSNAPILAILIPMGAAGIALTGKVFPRFRGLRQIAIVALLPGVIVLAATIGPVFRTGTVVRYALGGFTMEPGIILVLDGLAWVSSALITFVSILVSVASLSDRRFDATYFFFLLMTVAGMQSVVFTGDLFTMFVSFEIVAIGVYVLIAWERTPQGLLASLKYLFLSSVGILFFLLGIFLVYRDLGTMSMLRIVELAPELPALGADPGGVFPAAGPSRSIPLAIAALCVGIGVRTAFIPFHTWLPEAHAWAPHPVSALLSGVLIKISFLAMVRIVTVFTASYLLPLFLWIGGVTAVVAVFWALMQHDAKRLLAFHSISQMGYILAAWGAGGVLAEVASFSHAISHALFKSLLFIVVGIAIERTGTRNVYRMRGVGKGAPLLALGLVVGALAISGVPPFNGYVSKGLVSAAVYGSPVYLMLQAASVATAASFIKLAMVLLPERVAPGGTAAVLPAHHESRRSLPVTEGAVIVVLILAVVVGGLLGGRFGESLVVLTGGLDGVDPGVFSHLFTVDRIVDALIPVAGGGVLTVVVVSSRGRAFSRRISAVAPQLRTVLMFFAVGLVLFAIVPLLG